MSILKLKKLEEYLQCVDSFEKPKIMLEQYVTPSHISSQMLFHCQNNYGDIENQLVADLGSGSGMLSIGAALLGASHVVGFELDPDAIEVAKNNVEEMEIPNIDFVNCCVLEGIINNENTTRWTNKFDTVIMNPPFGTKKNAGIDMKFLKIGIALAKSTVYSLHKTSTREYIQRKTKELNVTGEVVAELKYNLESSFKCHKRTSVDIQVDFWRFTVAESS
ncbi:unnamed protein product [Diamesa hyperborea]